MDNYRLDRLNFRAGGIDYSFGESFYRKDKILEDEKLFIPIRNVAGKHLLIYEMIDVIKYLNDSSWVIVN